MDDQPQRSRLGEFFAEISRRHVGRFVFAYAATAFVLLQLAEIVFPAFGIGESGVRLIVAVAALGFPPALVVAWLYDISREGITRTEGEPHGPMIKGIALGSLLVVTVAAAGGTGLYLARQGVFDPTGPAGRPDRTPVLSAAYDPSQPIRSIAVLPLKDNSPSRDQAYFAASMHEELIAKLSQVDELRVVSRTSVMRYQSDTVSTPQIGRELNVEVLVEGSVIRTDQRTRVTLQLIHAPSDSHIRTLQWDRESIEDVLAFQTAIAHEVVEAVASQHDEAEFALASRDVDPAAQEAYFRGRFEYDRGTSEGYRMAMEYFEDALARDPDFAQALSGIASARFLETLASDDPSEDALMQAMAEADRALNLDSTSAETREVHALIERNLPRILGRPAPEPPAPAIAGSSTTVGFGVGSDSLPFDMQVFDSAWAAPTTTLSERIQESVWQRADERGDRSMGRVVFEARQMLSTGRYEEAERTLEAAVRREPGAASGWDMLVRSHVARGDPEGAVAVVRRWVGAAPDGGPTESDARTLEAAIEASGTDGYWEWRLRQLEEADGQGRAVSNFEIATSHAALGHDEDALEHLVRALRSGEPGIASIRTDPVWDGLRADPRLRELLRDAQRTRFDPRSRPARPPGG